MSTSPAALTFFVSGIPQTQGGSREVPLRGKGGVLTGRTALITTGSKDLKPWRAKVTQVAQLAMNLAHWQTLIGCPVGTTFRFFLPMPQSRLAAVRRGGISLAHVGYDIDKLTRAIHDSLTAAKVYKDDSQVARSAQVKWEINPGHLAGVEVIVERLEEEITEPMARALARRQAAPRL